MQGKHLITTDACFFAPDGRQYQAAWGDVQIVEDVFLGVKTNRNTSNWFAKVGSEDNHIIIAGCQIHYAVRCNEEPNTGNCPDWRADGPNGFNAFERPTLIYIAK